MGEEFETAYDNGIHIPFCFLRQIPAHVQMDGRGEYVQESLYEGCLLKDVSLVRNFNTDYYESSPIKDKNKYSIYYNNNKSNSPYQNNNQSHSKGHYANYGAMPNISCYNTKEKINSYRDMNERNHLLLIQQFHQMLVLNQYMSLFRIPIHNLCVFLMT